MHKSWKKVGLFVGLMGALMLATSCQTPPEESSKQPTKQEIFKEFMEADSVDLKLFLDGRDQSTGLYHIIATETAVSMETIGMLDSMMPHRITITAEDNTTYFQTLSYCLYTTVEDVENENEEEIDYEDVFTDFEEQEAYLKFTVSNEELFESLEGLLSGVVGEEELNMEGKCYFQESKVERIEFAMEEYTLRIAVESYNTNETVEIPSKKFYTKVDPSDIIYYLYGGVLPGNPTPGNPTPGNPTPGNPTPGNPTPGNPTPDAPTPEPVSNFSLDLNQRVFNIELGDELNIELSGSIYDKNTYSIVEQLTNEQLTIEPYDFKTPGTYNLTVTANYLGYKVSQTITVNVTKALTRLSDNKLNIDGELQYAFEVGGDLYLCDENYVYKYLIGMNTWFARIDLKCTANFHYVKGDYLYISANFPYSDSYLEEDAYDGTITKIKLSDFSLEKQVHVECYPYSIIVDKRDTVIITKGLNQHIGVSSVNMEDGSLTKLFRGYEKDVLTYNEETDTLILTSVNTTADPKVYKYNNALGAYELKGSAGVDFGKYIKTKDGLLITGSCVFAYNDFIEDYVAYNLKREDGDDYYKWSCETADYYNGYVYQICKNQNGSSPDKKLFVYNYLTGKYIKYEIPVTEGNVNVVFMTIKNDQIYLFTKSMFTTSGKMLIYSLK